MDERKQIAILILTKILGDQYQYCPCEHCEQLLEIAATFHDVLSAHLELNSINAPPPTMH